MMFHMEKRTGRATAKQIWRRLLRPTPARMLTAGFLVLILVGSLLLSMPISSHAGRWTPYLDALFTATSAVCVTGLVVLDTATYWSFFGQGILLVLIQTGALGIMSIVTLFATVTGKRLGLTQRMAIRDSMSEVKLKDVAGTFRMILLATISMELVGALLFAFILIPQYGWGPGIWKSIFHAVSAFCNAGFDLFGTAETPFQSLGGFSGHLPMTLVTSLLIVIGGLGFLVWQELVLVRKFTKMSLHTKAILVMTGILLTGGTALFLLSFGQDPAMDADKPA